MSERAIFPYHNGERQVYGDPMALSRRLTIHAGGDIDALVRDWRKDPVLDDAGQELPGSRALRLQHEEKIVEAVRKAFQMIPWDDSTGQGATWDQCMTAFEDFLRFWEKNG